MIKPSRLKKGDKVAIISLSSGLLGEPFMAPQRKIIEERLNSFGLEVVYTPNSLKGLKFIENHPEVRAEDLKWAFADDSIKAIIAAIGGTDTYKTVPYLLSDENFINNVKNNPKIFIGYSDTTVNHLMFQKIGLTTYYGHSAIVDFGELAEEMLPYSKMWFEKLFNNETNIEIQSSPLWYLERTNFGESEIGKERTKIKEKNGYEVIVGGKATGELFGGCLESLSDLLSEEENNEYHLFPSLEELQGKILFLETSEERPTPEELNRLLTKIDNSGAFKEVNGIIIGKPHDERYYDEYKKVYSHIIGKYNKPTIFNVNFGHAHPRCILPYGCKITLECDKKKITINESLVL